MLSTQIEAIAPADRGGCRASTFRRQLCVLNSEIDSAFRRSDDPGQVIMIAAACERLDDVDVSIRQPGYLCVFARS